MSDFKLRISDIFRYVVLGAVQATLCYAALGDDIINHIPSGIKLLFEDPIVTLVIAISSFYLSGYLTQIIIKLFFMGNMMGTGIGEIGKFINKWPLLNRDKYPHWLYYTMQPDKLLGIYCEIMETNDDSDVKTEYLYAGNLFQGIALSLVVFAFFALHDTLSVWIVLKAFAAVIFLCVIGNLSTKRTWALIANKVMILVVPLTISTVYALYDKTTLGLSIAGGIFVCLCVACRLARRHIRRIDILIKYGNRGENEGRFISNLKRNGVPRAFILTRVDDSAYCYYEEQLKSIKGQRYPNIKAIVLIDGQRSKNHYNDIVDLIDRYRKDGLDISHYTSEGSGAASLAYEIRDIFLNYADSDDVAITLDSDDLFAGREAVARIMGRMARTKANICLLSFEFFGDSRLNFAKNHPNEIVREIANQFTDNGKSIKPDKLLEMGIAHLISTIGWTKCYRKSALGEYQQKWDLYKKELHKHTKYEDFPDIVALLSKKSRICAVGHTSILFRKRTGSVTSTIKQENYHDIIYYLGLALRISTDNPNISKATCELIRHKFVPYKFLQYLNIVNIKTTGSNPEIPDYSAKMFYESFVSKVYADNRDELNQGLVDILKENHTLYKYGHPGYYGKDLPDSLKKENVTFDDIAKVFSL